MAPLGDFWSNFGFAFRLCSSASATNSVNFRSFDFFRLWDDEDNTGADLADASNMVCVLVGFDDTGADLADASNMVCLLVGFGFVNSFPSALDVELRRRVLRVVVGVLDAAAA